MKQLDIDKKIKELKKEIAELEAERDGTTGIKPSQTKELIDKYYGKCFRFDGVEEGSLEVMLESIFVDREKTTIKIDGKYIIYCTPDMSCIGLNNNMWIYGGTILIEGAMDIEQFPYTDIDWEESIYKQLDEIFTDHEISIEEFEADVAEACDYADDFPYVTPMEDLDEREKNNIYKHL